jgi:hypothetical protein
MDDRRIDAAVNDPGSTEGSSRVIAALDAVFATL